MAKAANKSTAVRSKKSRPLTVKSAAELDFAPDARILRQKAKMLRRADDMAMIAKMAIGVLTSTKSKLIEFAKAEDEAFLHLAQDLGSAQSWAEGFSEACVAAEARMLVAAAAAQLEPAA